MGPGFSFSFAALWALPEPTLDDDDDNFSHNLRGLVAHLCVFMQALSSFLGPGGSGPLRFVKHVEI